MAWSNIGNMEIERLQRVWEGWKASGAIKNTDSHFIWKKGLNSSGYGKCKLSLSQQTGEDKVKQVLAHRLSYKLSHPDFDMDFKGEDNLTVSHLCGKKTCVEPSHLVLEPLSVNSSRRSCMRKRRNRSTCTGHIFEKEDNDPIPYPPCLV